MNKIFTFFIQIWTVSIRRQLMMGIILVHAVLMSIFVFDLVERQSNFLHEQSVQQAKSLSQTLAVNSTSWVLANDVIGLEEVMDAQKNYPSLQNAMVIDTRGRVLAHTDIGKVGLYLNDPVSAKLIISKKEQVILINNTQTIDVASQIKSNDVFIGWVRVSLTQEENSKNLQTILHDGMLYTIFAIVIGALFAYLMAKGITTGLQEIVNVAEGIKLGKQSLRAKVSRHDEIGTLGNDINIMLDTVAKSKRDLQAIMDNSPTIIYVKNIEGTFTFINKTFEKVINIKCEDIIGQSLHDIYPQNIADEILQNDKDVLETGQPLESEENAPQDDGMHTYSSIKFPLYNDEGKIYGLCGISTDITERLKMTSEKAALELQLFHTQKVQAIGQLTGGVAHDFNNLLAVILGYTDLSKEMFARDNESLNKYLTEIETAGKRGRDLIQQMMIYSRKDQSQNDIVPLKIATILDETISMLKATFPSGILIKTLIKDEIPLIQGNSSLLTQVLMNLCINAKDSMGSEGDLLISVSVESVNNQICDACHETYAGKFVVVDVKDNGEGIDTEHLERIFEPFFTLKRVGEGTGMGLSVVHGVVHKLGGHINVESILGKGTSFKILLPISDHILEPEAKESRIKVSFDFSDMKIMVVDDEIAVSGLLEEVLKLHKASVVAFNDSEQAAIYFEDNKNNIDLVITDQTMPKLTGEELSKRLLEARPDIDIILCTGHSDTVTEETALKAGIKSFIHKPIKIDSLYKIIKELKELP